MCDVLIVDGELMMVSAKGHATGSQDCCTAVSTLMYTLAGYLKNDPEARIDMVQLEEADARVIFAGGKEARGAFQMAKIGFLQLQKAYGQYLSVNVMG